MKSHAQGHAAVHKQLGENRNPRAGHSTTNSTVNLLDVSKEVMREVTALPTHPVPSPPALAPTFCTSLPHPPNGAAPSGSESF